MFAIGGLFAKVFAFDLLPINVSKSASGSSSKLKPYLTKKSKIMKIMNSRNLSIFSIRKSRTRTW